MGDWHGVSVGKGEREKKGIKGSEKNIIGTILYEQPAVGAYCVALIFAAYISVPLNLYKSAGHSIHTYS